MPTDPSVIRLMAVLAVLVTAPLSLALGLRALELAGLLRGARAQVAPVVRLAPGRGRGRERLRGDGLRGIAGCVLGALALAACAALAAVAAVRGQA
ncbi:hypothetical protein [Streptomyces abyssomicinicus]|uniref:hypothetical protein n=1 Tax=Streptomyces abyssomicinicus TaxID=574929 RepID=UPI001250A8B4|nr:hypothetical protein [Streptomyces abyssomicinicus]